MKPPEKSFPDRGFFILILDKAKPSVRSGLESAGLRKLKMAELPKDKSFATRLFLFSVPDSKITQLE